MIALDPYAEKFKPYLAAIAKAAGLSTAKVGVSISENDCEPEMVDGEVRLPLWLIDYPPQLAYSWLHELSHARDFHDGTPEGSNYGEDKAYGREWSLPDDTIWDIAEKSGLWINEEEQ
jgi:hypothetical protein